jgi:hypothetical protein
MSSSHLVPHKVPTSISKNVSIYKNSIVKSDLTLYHDFKQSNYRIKGPNIPFSRASGATMFNSSGELVWAPENLLTWSEDFDNNAWQTISSSKNNDEEGFYFNTSPSGSGRLFQNITTEPSTVFTLEIVCKDRTGGSLLRPYIGDTVAYFGQEVTQ